MKERIADLETVKQVFDKYNVKFYVVFGALLGMHRDGKLIDHDDDIDLVVIDQVDFKTKKAIGWSLYDLGFGVQNIAFNVFGRMEPAEIGYNGDESTGIIVCERATKFSIFFYDRPSFCRQHNEAELTCRPKLGAVVLQAIPQRLFEKSTTITINKKKYLAPAPIEKFLEHCYQDWKDKTGRDHYPTSPEYHAQGSITKEEANSVMIK